MLAGLYAFKIHVRVRYESTTVLRYLSIKLCDFIVLNLLNSPWGNLVTLSMYVYH